MTTEQTITEVSPETLEFVQKLFIAFVKIEMEVGGVTQKEAKRIVKEYMYSDKFIQSLKK